MQSPNRLRSANGMAQQAEAALFASPNSLKMAGAQSTGSAQSEDSGAETPTVGPQHSNTSSAKGAEAPKSEQQRRMFWKTKRCRFFGRNMCTNGDSCIFAHGEEELRPSPEVVKMKPCKAFLLAGRCNDTPCKYAHSPEELKNPKAWKLPAALPSTAPAAVVGQSAPVLPTQALQDPNAALAISSAPALTGNLGEQVIGSPARSVRSTSAMPAPLAPGLLANPMIKSQLEGQNYAEREVGQSAGGPSPVMFGNAFKLRHLPGTANQPQPLSPRSRGDQNSAGREERRSFTADATSQQIANKVGSNMQSFLAKWDFEPEVAKYLQGLFDPPSAANSSDFGGLPGFSADQQAQGSYQSYTQQPSLYEPDDNIMSNNDSLTAYFAQPPPNQMAAPNQMSGLPFQQQPPPPAGGQLQKQLQRQLQKQRQQQQQQLPEPPLKHHQQQLQQSQQQLHQQQLQQQQQQQPPLCPPSPLQRLQRYQQFNNNNNSSSGGSQGGSNSGSGGSASLSPTNKQVATSSTLPPPQTEEYTESCSSSFFMPSGGDAAASGTAFGRGPLSTLSEGSLPAWCGGSGLSNAPFTRGCGRSSTADELPGLFSSSELKQASPFPMTTMDSLAPYDGKYFTPTLDEFEAVELFYDEDGEGNDSSSINNYNGGGANNSNNNSSDKGPSSPSSQGGVANWRPLSSFSQGLTGARRRRGGFAATMETLPDCDLGEDEAREETSRLMPSHFQSSPAIPAPATEAAREVESPMMAHASSGSRSLPAQDKRLSNSLSQLYDSLAVKNTFLSLHPEKPVALSAWQHSCTENVLPLPERFIHTEDALPRLVMDETSPVHSGQ